MYWLQFDGFSLSVCVFRQGLYLQIFKEFLFAIPLMTCISLCEKVVNGIDLHVKLS